MPSSPPITAPAIEIIGTDAEPSDSAIGALARLLLAVADHDTHTPPSPAAAVARVLLFAANEDR